MKSKIKITISIVFAILLNLSNLLLWIVDAILFWDLLNIGAHGVATVDEDFPYFMLIIIIGFAYFSTLKIINSYEKGILSCSITMMFLMWISSFLTEIEALIVHFGGGAVVSFISLFIVYKEICNRSSDSK